MLKGEVKVDIFMDKKRIFAFIAISNDSLNPLFCTYSTHICMYLLTYIHI